MRIDLILLTLKLKTQFRFSWIDYLNVFIGDYWVFILK